MLHWREITWYVTKEGSPAYERYCSLTTYERTHISFESNLFIMEWACLYVISNERPGWNVKRIFIGRMLLGLVLFIMNHFSRFSFDKFKIFHCELLPPRCFLTVRNAHFLFYRTQLFLVWWNSTLSSHISRMHTQMSSIKVVYDKISENRILIIFSTTTIFIIFINAIIFDEIVFYDKN